MSPFRGGADLRISLRRLAVARGRHLWWLLFWPVYWLRYPLIEHGRGDVQYAPVYCPADDWIPFCEVFIIPYMLWMVLMVAICLYTLCCDGGTFQRYSRFLVIAMSVSTVIFLLWPSCQELRPEVFPRDNLLSRCVALLYSADTNTNVFPSEHAIGAVAMWLAVRRARGLKTLRLRGPLCVLAVLTCVSTVFLKQHSLLDLLGAVPVCLIAWWFSFREPRTARKV